MREHAAGLVSPAAASCCEVPRCCERPPRAAGWARTAWSLWRRATPGRAGERAAAQRGEHAPCEAPRGEAGLVAGGEHHLVAAEQAGLLPARADSGGHEGAALRPGGRAGCPTWPACAAALVAAAVLAAAASLGLGGVRAQGSREAGRLLSLQRDLVQFHWVHDMARCVGVGGGPEGARRGASLVLTSCAEAPLVFTMPGLEDKFIRVAGRPDLCVHSPLETPKLRLWNCSEYLNMQFILQASPGNRTRGSIRGLWNSTMCMGALQDRVGEPMEMHECTNSTTDFFMMNLVLEGSLLGAALDPDSEVQADAGGASPGLRLSSGVAKAKAAIDEAEALAVSILTQAASGATQAVTNATEVVEASLREAGAMSAGASAILQNELNRTGEAVRNWVRWH